MADIRLGVSGDASGGVSAMNDMGDAVGKSAVKWTELANAAKASAKAVIDFVVESTKKYAESERIQRQLVRTSGEYAEALDEQAKALSKLYAVDDDVINQSQILLSQWGKAGAASKEAETAALNLAAAYGMDLNTATEMLIRNVESGGTGLAKMGIHFEATGKKGKDLQSAIAAINAKLGGAAGAEASSLIGRTHAAQLAFEDLQKSIGGMAASALEKTGALDFLTEKIRQLTKGLEVAYAVGSKLPGILGGVLLGNISPGTAIDELRNTAADALLGGVVSAPKPPKVDDDPTNKKPTTKPGRTDEERLADAKEFYKGIETLADTAAQQEEDAYARELGLSAKRVEVDIKESEERIKVRRDMLLTIEKENAAHAEKMDKEQAKLEEKALKDSNERSAKKAKEAQAAGDAIGAAMVNALADQLAKLAEGGEFDAALFIGDILAAAVGVAGGIIGTAFGAPAVGAAIGNLAAMGIRAGSSAISRSNKQAKARSNTYHDGGWVDAPRHHDGAWIGPDEQRAILQTNERVLSRREVANMGGPGAVDRSARGGAAGVTINVQAIDAKSAADSLTTELGKGMRDAVRRGQGALPSLLGIGPR